MTFPTALAAPVEEGMMLLFTLRPPRQSLCDGPSTVFWVAVVAWTVVINPSAMPKLSCMILARGARQLVVHDALEIYRWLSTKTYQNRAEKTHDFRLAVVLFMVDANDKHGRVRRRSSDDDFLRAAFQMGLGPVRVINTADKCRHAILTFQSS